MLEEIVTINIEDEEKRDLVDIQVELLEQEWEVEQRSNRLVFEIKGEDDSYINESISEIVLWLLEKGVENFTLVKGKLYQYE